MFSKSILLCVAFLLAAVGSISAQTTAAQTKAAQTAPTLSDILEQAAYQQDTANDPERAIKLYRQVIESEKATREMIAQALYNTGLCYAKLKQSREADQAFGAVVSQYKNAEPYYRLANAQLNPSFAPTLPRWQDGERLEYEVRAGNVDDVRNYFWTTTTKVDWNGRSAWKLLNRSLGNNGLSMTIADEKSLRPLFSRADNPDIGHATGTWTDNSLEINRSNQERATETRFEGVVYDAEQQKWLLRQIPMTVGTKIRAQQMSALVSVKASPFAIEVTSEEQVQVPAGQFNAYKLTGNNGTTHIWIDKGPERYLLKVASPTSTLQLKRISRVTPNAWRTVTLDATGFRISIPDEWFNVTRKGETKAPGVKTINGKAEGAAIAVPKEEIAVVDDDTKVKMAIEVVDAKSLQESSGIDLSLAGWEANSEEMMKKKLKNYAVREGSKVDRLIANSPAISTIVDYQERGEDFVFYLTVFKRDTTLGLVAFSTPKKHLDEAKPTFDRILGTIAF